jgi:hypothetical protein
VRADRGRRADSYARPDGRHDADADTHDDTRGGYANAYADSNGDTGRDHAYAHANGYHRPVTSSIGKPVPNAFAWRITVADRKPGAERVKWSGG